MQIDAQLSAKFARLSFVAAIMVLIQHMYAPYWSGWVETSICFGLVLWDVPYFFFAAGFFLFGDFEQNFSWYRIKLRSRVRSLLVPYFCWTAFGLSAAVISIILGLKPNTLNWSSPNWWLNTLGVSEASWYAGQLWFFRRLMFFVIISPALGWIAKRRMALGLVPVLWLFYIFDAPSAGTWSNLSFFMLGAIVSFRRDWLAASSLAAKLVFPILWPIYCIVPFVAHWTDAQSLRISRCGEMLVIVLGLVAFWGLYERARGLFAKLDRWAFYSLFVYGLHLPLSVYVKLPIRAILPQTHGTGTGGGGGLSCPPLCCWSFVCSRDLSFQGIFRDCLRLLTEGA